MRAEAEPFAAPDAAALQAILPHLAHRAELAFGAEPINPMNRITPREQLILEQLASILKDPEASPNDRFVALDLLKKLRSAGDRAKQVLSVERLLRHQIERCDGILYTHNHVDHTFGLDDTRRFNAVMKAPIDIYADDHTMRHLHRVYQHIFEKHNNINDSFVATLIPHLIDPARPIDLHGLRFTPLPLLHGKLPVLGYRIEQTNPDGSICDTQPAPLPLAYCTDVSHIPPGTWPLLDGLHTLVLDMLRYRRHPTHLTVDQALEIAERIGAAQTRFTHMTHDILHADLDPRLPGSMALAHDGMVIRG